MGMKPTFSNFRVTVLCINENMDFGIHWTKTLNLGFVFYEWSDSDKGGGGAVQDDGRPRDVWSR